MLRFVILAILGAALAEGFPIQTGSSINHFPNGDLDVTFPNKTTIQVQNGDGNFQKKKTGSSLPEQWLAWYFKSCISGTSFGFKSFSSVFEVPPVPKKASNLAIFNALQASYDPVPYNWILQPVLSTGNWMLGSSAGWTLSSVMCNPETGQCLYTNPIDTEPGNKILGVITQISGVPNSYRYEVNITDITANTPTQTLLFSSEYFAPWAFVSLEHAPEGAITDCDTLPDTSAISFTDNVLEPYSVDMWQGSQTEYACGIRVDMFPSSGDSHLDIRL